MHRCFGSGLASGPTSCHWSVAQLCSPVLCTPYYSFYDALVCSSFRLLPVFWHRIWIVRVEPCLHATWLFLWIMTALFYSLKRKLCWVYPPAPRIKPPEHSQYTKLFNRIYSHHIILPFKLFSAYEKCGVRIRNRAHRVGWSKCVWKNRVSALRSTKSLRVISDSMCLLLTCYPVLYWP